MEIGRGGLAAGRPALPPTVRFHPAVRYGLSHGRPRDLPIPLALTGRLPRYQQRDRRQAKLEQPWYLATHQPIAAQAVAWYRQRFWIEQSFKDSTSRFRLKHVQIGTPTRLTRLLLAPTIALCWLALAALPESSTLPAGWHAAVAAWGRASFLSRARGLLDETRDLPPPWLTSIL